MNAGEMPHPIAIPIWAATLLGAVLLAGLTVGLRLFRLASRTGGFPELALGTFVVSCALGNLGTLAAMRIDAQDPDFANLLAASAQLLVIVGNHALALATWRIYRRGAGWAAALVAAVSMALLVGWGANVVSGRPARLTEDSLSDLLVLGARSVIFAWWTAECFVHAAQLAQLRKRGLADARIVQRTALAGGMGLAGGGGVGVLLVGAWLLGADTRTNPVVLVLLAGMTLLMWWFIHLGFPPQRERRRRLGVVPS
jgi:hypothetical protein